MSQYHSRGPFKCPPEQFSTKNYLYDQSHLDYSRLMERLEYHQEQLASDKKALNDKHFSTILKEVERLPALKEAVENAKSKLPILIAGLRRDICDLEHDLSQLTERQLAMQAESRRQLLQEASREIDELTQVHYAHLGLAGQRALLHAIVGQLLRLQRIEALGAMQIHRSYVEGLAASVLTLLQDQAAREEKAPVGPDDLQESCAVLACLVQLGWLPAPHTN